MRKMCLTAGQWNSLWWRGAIALLTGHAVGGSNEHCRLERCWRCFCIRYPVRDAHRDALQLAHASAAASMRHIGTTDGIERWQHCLRLAAEYESAD